MKAVLEFDLDSFEDRENHRVALNGLQYKLIIEEFFDHIRQMSKYDSSLNESQLDLLERLRDKLAEIKNQRIENE